MEKIRRNQVENFENPYKDMDEAKKSIKINGPDSIYVTVADKYYKVIISEVKHNWIGIGWAISSITEVDLKYKM